MITDPQIADILADCPDRSTHGHHAWGWTYLEDICRDAMNDDPTKNWQRLSARAALTWIYRCMKAAEKEQAA